MSRSSARLRNYRNWLQQYVKGLWQKLPQLALSSLENVCGKNYRNWLLVVWRRFVAKITAKGPSMPTGGVRCVPCLDVAVPALC